MTAEELARLESAERPGWFRRIFRHSRLANAVAPGERFIDEYQATIETCFVLADFNEEVPLYVLDLGGVILLLFGQWLFDPHVVVASERILEVWAHERCFFADFTIRFSPETGMVFKLTVDSDRFAAAQVLTMERAFKRLRECEVIAGGAGTLTRDLQSAGLC